MSVAKYIAVVAFGLLANALPAQAQQQGPAQTRMAPQGASKTDLATRFADIKSQYVMLKVTAVRLVPPGTTDSIEQKQARLQLASTMRSYEYYEGQAQIQRDNLNALTALTETDFMRMKIALDRMARLQTIISNLIRTLDSRGAVVQNTN